MDDVLKLEHVSKSYGGIHALKDVSFQLKSGEVHSLIGENGAGKSTLIKIISGAIPDYDGEVSIGGKTVRFKNPLDAQNHKIAAIYQERSLIPSLNGAVNILLGQEPLRNKALGWIYKQELNKRARYYADLVAPGLPLDIPVRKMSAAQQQLIEIAKALSRDPDIIIMDEPTSSLTDKETVLLISIIKRLREMGKSIIFISHKLKDIFEVSNTITVLRDGMVVENSDAAGVTEADLVRMMVGRSIKNLFPKEDVEIGEEILRAEGLSRKGKFRDISYQVHAGEILGVAGLVGAGRSEMAMSIFGGDKLDSGTVYLEGKKITVKNPSDAIAKGIGLVPEDRKYQGLILGMPIKDNMVLAILKQYSKWFFNDNRKQNRTVDEYMKKLDIKAPSKQQKVKNLSGGNQQKVVIGKWLSVKPKVLIMDEPTRGIDVGTKAEIYKLIGQLAKEGMAIILISSEMPEILGLSDRILVMREGRIAAELSRKEATEEKILKLYLGGIRDEKGN
ncbi:sugar ABC transporter ATP-binding protein [Lacrimispora sp. NSJ-141]|uniref:Sugar ABC transporter ATP-binding protein n=1 Tax=Lientehia hominis TaxID=2897778 RepID=A0AAP2RK77_9FIRM|nr:sugar ABC transporter ATP-binding protein [Lientehia hominis]MCD2493742.1 sugar ABC transporter ATP-binding protein [Lientehia hominis]